MNLFIGNAISLSAAYFTARSSWAKDRWHIYIYQVVQCLLLAAASIFFASYAGVVSLLGCALRNYLAALDRLNKKTTLLCLLLVLIPAVVLNNRGYIGWIVIAANVLYTAGMYAAKTELTIKVNMIVNLILWIVYELLIIDIPSVAADGVGLVMVILSLKKEKIKIKKFKKCA